MRAPHTSHNLASFPVYSSAFLSPTKLVLGGGGGASRTGIKNKIRLYNVSAEREIDLVDELELGKDEDVPMSMAADQESSTLVCGINSALQNIEKGINENCRLFKVKEDKLTSAVTKGTLSTKDTEDFQKVTVLSPDSKLLAVGGTRDLALLSFPSLAPAASPIRIEEGEIYDATFSSSTLIVVTTVSLLVYALPTTASAENSPTSSPKKKKGKSKPKAASGGVSDLELLKTVPIPSYFDATASSTFRAARYHPTNANILFTAINTVPQRAKKSRTPARQAYVVQWNTESWAVSTMLRVGDCGLTCFDISGNGKLLGYGISDCTIGMLDAGNLAPVVSILKAHDFPPTTLKFNQTSTLLLSGSADNSVRIVSVPQDVGSTPYILYLLIIATIAVVLAVLMQLFLKP